MISLLKDSILDAQMEIEPNKRKLLEMAHYRMPYGKYKDRHLVNLPIAYLVWFKQKGFPKGKLGEYLETMLDIKSNGLEPVIYKLQKEFPKE
jgi:uncharacterized protein (DUF3820 family)